MSGMQALKAHVRNGHFVIDEPTDLPEGTVVELVVLRVLLPSGKAIEGEALQQLLSDHRRQEEGVTR